MSYIPWILGLEAVYSWEEEATLKRGNDIQIQGACRTCMGTNKLVLERRTREMIFAAKVFENPHFKPSCVLFLNPKP